MGPFHHSDLGWISNPLYKHDDIDWFSLRLTYHFAGETWWRGFCMLYQCETYVAVLCRTQKAALVKQTETKFQIIFGANEHRSHETFNFTEKVVLTGPAKEATKTAVLISTTRLVN